MSPDTLLHIQRSFAAPRDLVFRVWTEPEALEGWFRPKGMRTKVRALDLRIGGLYSFEVIAPDGASGSISGRYIEIVRPEKLVFTWVSHETDELETLVTLKFAERAGVTEIALTHERFAGEGMTYQHRLGWNWMMDQLGTYL